MQWSRPLTWLAMCALVLGCSKSTENDPASKPAVRAPELINRSFKVATNTGAPKISIQKSSLDKEFLLQASVIQQVPVPMGQGMKSRVVAFRRQADKVYMMEATQGHTVTNDFPQELVLAEFPILGETAEELAFDFNEGMSTTYMVSDWYAHDFDGKMYQETWMGQKLGAHRIVSAESDAKNRLVIRQVGQITLAPFGIVELQSPVEVKYYLSPYRPDPSYASVPSKDFKNTGFFEVAPLLLPSGATTVWASKFNEKKPIQFAISPNTPEAYKQAVKDGVLYWNKAFAKPIVEVVEAPAGVVAPDINYNVIQWVPWDRAGMAYADGQMDPRTGEILHAQVFLTSAFAVSGKTRARALLRTLKGLDKKEYSPQRFRFGVAGMKAEGLCAYDTTKAFARSLRALVASDASDDQILRASQDYVRTVAAHEVGHTLGLRHNFAGSLHTDNYALDERHNHVEQYLQHDHMEANVVPSSSVMDYPQFEEDMLIGARIRKGYAPLSYDQMAVSVLYEGKHYKRGEIPPFCTDSHLFRFVDCKQFDVGASVVEFAAHNTQQELKDLPYDLAEKYVAAKSPVEGAFEIPLEEVPLSPDSVVEMVMSPLSDVLDSFTSDNRLLTIYNLFPFVTELNLEEVRKKEKAYLTAEIEKEGGLDRVFVTPSPDFPKETLAKFSEIIQSEKYAKGTGPGGKDYEFTAADRDAMLASVGALMEKLPEPIAKKDLEILGRVPADWKVAGTTLGDDLLQVLTKRVEQYVFTSTGAVTEVTLEVPIAAEEGKKDEKPAPDAPKTRNLTAKLPKFFYKHDIRKAAAPILAPSTEQDGIDWGVIERAQVKKSFKERLSAALGCEKDNKSCDIDKIKVEEIKVVAAEGAKPEETAKLQKAVTRWLVENKAVMGEFK